MKKSTTQRAEKRSPGIGALLFAYGISGTLDYLCTFSAFSVLSAA